MLRRLFPFILIISACAAINPQVSSLGSLSVLGFSVSEFTSDGSTVCVIVQGGRLRCWGDNSHGQVGIGSTTATLSPAAVDDSTVFIKVATDSGTTCAITSSGVLKCWGRNNFGQVGCGPGCAGTDQLTPVVIDPGVTYNSISTKSQTTCGLTQISQDIKCWGNNSNGQVGNGNTTSQNLPTTVSTAGPYYGLNQFPNHACAFGMGGIFCWGSNIYGQVGNGGGTNVMVPSLVDAGTNYRQISGDQDHTCGVVDVTGVLKCWGHNNIGQLGVGDVAAHNTPTVVDSGVSYSTNDHNNVAMSSDTMCAITASGTLKCWGDNTNGQIGDGTTTTRITPQIIDSSSAYNRINQSFGTACGVTSDGVLKCWGLNTNGQVGDGTVTSRSLPTIVDAGVVYAETGTAGSTSYGLRTTGTLMSWGYNFLGQTGSGTNTTSILTPVTVGLKSP